MGKPKCKYWEKCFRKDKTHKAAFIHPGEDGADSDDSQKSEQNDKVPSTSATPATDLSSKKVVFTGTLLGCTRAQAEEKARDYGCHITKTVTKATDILVVGEEAGSKEDKAKALGITVMTQSAWEKLLRQSDKVKPTRSVRGTRMDYNEDSEDEEEKPAIKATKRKLVSVDSNVSVVGGTQVNGKSIRESRAGTSKGKATKKKQSHSISDSEGSETEVDTEEDEPSPPKKAKTSDDEEEKALKKKTDDSSPAKKRRVKCKYGKKCFRKNRDHCKEFCHPGDSDEEDAVEKMEEEDEAVDLPDPKKKMADGESVTIEGKHQDYTIKRTGDTYYCTCYQWKMSKRAPNKRSCKHLKEHLGEKFEDARCGEEIVPGSENITRGIRHKAIPQVMLAQKWDEKTVDPTGWWISEKLDGVRAYWDGHAFFSRLGNEFIPPSWFIKGFPSDMVLDGELFGGRKMFQSTVSIVKTPGSGRWKDVKFYIFDAPGLKAPFEQRVATVADYFKKNDAPYIHPLEHEKCRGVDHIKEELEKVQKKGGEGLMIREPKSMYEHRRSKTLLKIKTFYDAEAVVIGHENGKGRNQFVCGAIVCKMECGKKFKVGTGLKDAERRKPPKVGSIITYRFQEYTLDGVPRFPSYVGIRIDADEPKDAVLPKIVKEDE